MRIRPLTAVCVALVLAGAAVLPAHAAEDPYMRDQYALRQIGAPTAWQASRGAGVTIAVIDTGIDAAHEDLATKIIAGRDFVDGDSTPTDGQGHGTMVAGLAAAATSNGIGIAGTAPDARIMPVRVIAGTVAPEDEEPCRAADGIRWAADNGARVINVSLTSEVDFLRFVFACSLEQAINYAWSRGSLVVAAAGNSQQSSSSRPSGYAAGVKALIVTAVDAEGRQPAYANQADTDWSIAAPGDAVVSTAPGGYKVASGTSMATPHVSGVAALLFATGLTNAQVVDRILSTAKPLPLAVEAGSGLVDAAAALGVSGTVPTAAPTSPPTTARPRPRPRPTSAPAPTTSPSPTAPASGVPTSGVPTTASDGVLAIPDRVAVPSPAVPVAAGADRGGDESSDRTWPAVAAGALLLGALASLVGARGRT